MDLSTIKEAINRRNIVLSIGIFCLSISLSFGIGYILGKADEKAPIIIEGYE